MAITLPVPHDRNLYFTKEVNQDTIAELAKNIIEINRDDEYLGKLCSVHEFTYVPRPIIIHIDSYGGSVYQCLGLIGVINQSKIPIHTYVTGVAMSAGLIIAIHGHKRFAYEYATYMYHQLSGMAWGKMADLEQDIKEFKRLQNLLEELVVQKTKISIEILRDNFDRKQDWFMPAKEALQFGCVDEIL